MPAAAVKNRYVTFAVGAWKATVVVLAPLVAVMVLELLPCSVKLWLVAPTVKLLLGVIVLAVSVPPTVAPPFKDAAPVTANVPVKLAELLIVCPLIVPLSVRAPDGATANRLLPFKRKSTKFPVALALVLFTVNITPLAWLDVRVSWPKVGVAVVWISWIVFIVPDNALKLLALNWAIPF